jgi:chromate transporter
VPAATRPGYSELAGVFLRLSILGFGGPNAHLALMLDDIVERRRWISREQFLHAIGLTNLLPGPNSSEVAIHIGYTQRGWRGGLVAGVAFVAPTFVLVVLLSAVYFRYARVPALEGMLWGLKPAIVAIVLGAGWKLGRAAVTDVLLACLSLGGVLVAVFLDRWEVAAMAAGGIVAGLIYSRRTPLASASNAPVSSAHPAGQGHAGESRAPSVESAVLLLPVAVTMASVGELGRLLWLTLWAGSVLFGGGYMLVALIEPYVVDTYGWLTNEQFVEGIAVTQAVPGPIVTLVAFVGYGVAGLPGAAIATVGVYLPSFAAVFMAAPLLDRWRHVDWVKAALKGVNAVVAGAIGGVALTMVPPSVPDAWAAALLAAAVLATFAFRIGATWLVLAGLVAGLLRSLFTM